jgi:phospholipid transport system transporter-binding protein
MRAYRAGNIHALAITERSAGLFVIKGDLTFATINTKTLNNIDCTQSGTTIHIDLQEVVSTDSAGLALMIEWLKISKQHNGTLNFINIPQQLQALAKISGFDPKLSSTTLN